MVAAVEAIDTAFCTASLVTRAGSMTPAFLTSTNSFAGFMTLTPKPDLPASTCASSASAFKPALRMICRNGCFKASFRICRPAAMLSAPVTFRPPAKFTKVTPPPATIPSAKAALVAATASSTRNFFSSISVSVAPPTLMTATLPLNAAARLSNCSFSYSLEALSDSALI